MTDKLHKATEDLKGFLHRRKHLPRPLKNPDGIFIPEGTTLDNLSYQMKQDIPITSSDKTVEDITFESVKLPKTIENKNTNYQSVLSLFDYLHYNFSMNDSEFINLYLEDEPSILAEMQDKLGESVDPVIKLFFELIKKRIKFLLDDLHKDESMKEININVRLERNNDGEFINFKDIAYQNKKINDLQHAILELINTSSEENYIMHIVDQYVELLCEIVMRSNYMNEMNHILDYLIIPPTTPKKTLNIKIDRRGMEYYTLYYCVELFAGLMENNLDLLEYIFQWLHKDLI